MNVNKMKENNVFRNELNSIWKDFDIVEWRNPAFSFKKALVCATFSKVTYWHMTKFELNNNSRVNIIPSGDYVLHKKNKICINVVEMLRQADFDKTFLIETEFAILIGIVVNEILFIAIRGTENLYDWITDFKILMKKGGSKTRIKYHRGFYNATLETLPKLQEKLDKLNGHFRSIYITGHSLGGGIAAILNSIMGDNSEFRIKNTSTLKNFISHSCYTFGMPKYGNIHAINFRSPYHIHHLNDFITKVPPSFFGYRRSNFEYSLENPDPKTNKLNWFSWKKRLTRTRKNHSIDNYLLSIKSKIQEHQ
ncbi:MAG: lipase family protein [Chitinophagaceae bacterium]|jgi:hypothetical protein